MINPIFKAKNLNGQISVKDKEKFNEHLRTLPEEVELVVKAIKESRSQSQNKYYWGVVVKIVADETGHSSEDIHDYLRTRLLQKWITIETKEGTREVCIVRSTTSLDTKEFCDYVSFCRQWASMELGVFIPDPGQIDYE